MSDSETETKTTNVVFKVKKSKKEKKLKKDKNDKKSKKRDKKEKKHKKMKKDQGSHKVIIGPTLQPSVSSTQSMPSQCSNMNSDSDDEIIGPMLPGQIKTSLEERALEIQIKNLEGTGSDEKKLEREEWMMELPEIHAQRIGFTARSFKPKMGPDFSDRSAWTETPNSSKHTKEIDELVELKKKRRLEVIEKNNEEQRMLVEEFNRDHNIGKSLLEIHQENRKKLKMVFIVKLYL